MRRIAVLAAISSTFAAPAFAQDGGFYAGAELGAVISSETDQTYTPGATAGSTGAISTEHELGLHGGAFAGYDFGAFRVELEAGYLSADVKKVKSNFALGTDLTAGSQDADGKVTVRSIMANATVDVGGFDDVVFFAGGGAGLAKLKISDVATASAPTALLDDEDDWRFAWQGIVGVRKPLTNNIDAHVRYRYFTTDDAEMVGRSGRAVSAEMSSHSLTAGVTFNF